VLTQRIAEGEPVATDVTMFSVMEEEIEAALVAAAWVAEAGGAVAALEELPVVEGAGSADAAARQQRIAERDMAGTVGDFRTMFHALRHPPSREELLAGGGGAAQ
jgi:hypothetical protein